MGEKLRLYGSINGEIAQGGGQTLDYDLEDVWGKGGGTNTEAPSELQSLRHHESGFQKSESQ